MQNKQSPSPLAAPAPDEKADTLSVSEGVQKQGQQGAFFY
jgi:hypothetical protein